MSLFDKLLGLKIVEEEDLTETTWWEKTVVQGLAQDGLVEPGAKEPSDREPTLRPGELN